MMKYTAFDEQMKQNWAPTIASLINMNDKNKYAIVCAKEDETTRVFLKRLCPMTDVVGKDGWWDYFTISKTPCKKGYWLAIVDSAKVDLNGYLNVCVTPEHFIGDEESLCEHSTAWEYFSKHGMFSSLISARDYGPFNIDELETLLIERAIISHEWRRENLPFVTFMAWKDGKISIREIEKAIDTPIPHRKSDAELAADKILLDEATREKYPNLVAKIEKHSWKTNAVIDHLYAMGGAYWRLLEQKVIEEINNDDMVILFLERAECINKYYANKKALEKAARKAARKNK